VLIRRLGTLAMTVLSWMLVTMLSLALLACADGQCTDDVMRVRPGQLPGLIEYVLTVGVHSGSNSVRLTTGRTWFSGWLGWATHVLFRGSGR
jgi:hypothetical protein